MQTQNKAMPQVHFNAKCDGCIKVTVCTIIKAISPLMAMNWAEGKRPFEATDLAIICKEYLNPTVNTEL